MRIVIALGGNAILQPGQKGTAAEQIANIRSTAKQIASIVKAGHEVILTHGNGPQIGAIILQNMGTTAVPAMPMDICGAESQGLLGYLLQQQLGLALAEADCPRPLVTVVTQTLVSKDDPAFQKPSKPIGPFYSEAEAKAKQAAEGGTWVDDAGRGWRKVVPSPDPIRIVERDAIKVLVDAGFLTISVGGGGIPVVEKDGGYAGVEAVIDKDLGGERLATDVGAAVLMILTDAPQACLNYRKPDQVVLGAIGLEDARRYYAEGHFASGSMGPKVKAAIRFVEHGGRAAIIASLNHALEALEGKTGTSISATGADMEALAAGR
jgi:carbamate kinase